jgi:hypothetical protein
MLLAAQLGQVGLTESNPHELGQTHKKIKKYVCIDLNLVY